MIDPKDADALCQAMLTIYNSTEVRQKMSAASLAQASTFSWQKCAEQTINAYKASIRIDTTVQVSDSSDR